MKQLQIELGVRWACFRRDACRNGQVHVLVKASSPQANTPRKT